MLPEFDTTAAADAAATQAAMLQLDPKHPGVHDLAYVGRRSQLYHIARHHRIHNLGLPFVKYAPHEHDVWRLVSGRLEDVHASYACGLYLRGKQRLLLTCDHMPQLAQLHAQLQQQHHFGLVAAEGLLDTRTFFAYLSEGLMPATQFLRHQSRPEYTPEPDAVHDVIGHVPSLLDGEYAEIVRLIGDGVRRARTDEHLLEWGRFYWFTIEFGLLEEAGDLKVFGAGLLSSIEEMRYCLSDAVARRMFDLHEVISTDYDTTRMQDVVYVLPSLSVLRQAVVDLLELQAASHGAGKNVPSPAYGRG